METDYATFQDEREALHVRTLRRRFPASFAALAFIERGSAFIGPDGAFMPGPALCYWPGGQAESVRISAGTRVRVLGLSDVIVLDAIGARAESVHLRMLVEKRFDAILADSRTLAQVRTLMDWFEEELTLGAQPSPMSLSAYLRMILITAMRLNGLSLADAASDRRGILARFRQLLELHYRDQWQVSRYVEELGVDYSRLHAICKRETKRSPAELIQERLTAEAKARLQHSGLSLKNIAEDLGFSDATRFSHFFKRRTGFSPGAYRTVVSSPKDDALDETGRGFHDWP